MTFLRKIKFKYILVLLVILIIIYGVSRLFFTEESDTRYITTKVEKGHIEQTVLADGKISAFKLVNVGAQVSGQIQKLYVQLGDKVKAGDMIAEIDDLKQKNDLMQSKASLASLQAQRTAKEANLKNYQLTYGRQLKLVNKGVGIQSDLDAAEAQLDVIKADIASLDADIIRAKIAVDTAEVNLGYTKITSPIDGIVVATPVEEGQTVNSVQSAPTIVKVAQLDKMTVEAQISEADVIKVKTGMPVYFTILGRPNMHFSGMTLRAVEPAPTSINNETSTSTTTTTAIYYNGLFDVDNPEHLLRISMTAQVYIVLANAENVLYIPSTSIQQNFGDGKATVFVLDDGQNIREKAIEIGIDNNVNVEVKSGLDLGDTIVVSRLDGGSVSKSRTPRMGF
ncbi:macrolide-specific efflux system membrane fusion protein [Orbus hercynius]|uniref:Macrolide-specific efflux system membrane fusion protein n=1 Tax=Orbus hercynius TaxID=593135 RepID=A0A495RF67_9GAMM|nr:efflux RND transporter periplasmic adaptor subunit [Orbus hercynius]RKS86021.1 macrolide-specific efflux system membrane fusion protein [Orbus hercynius]